MKNFLIEVDEETRELNLDFCYTVYNQIKFYNWYNKDKIDYYFLTLSELNSNLDKKYLEYTPIGSIEFIHTFMTFNNIKIPNAINIPKELNKKDYLWRDVYYGTKKDILTYPIFIKPKNQLKLFTGGSISSKSNLELLLPEIKDDTELILSESIDIKSEYRAFIFKNELVGLQHYLGDFKIFPDINVIENMIKDYKSAPIAYTLDIGIYDNKTILIEVHNFYSVGLYGFSRNMLLNMFSDFFMTLKK